MRITLKPKNEKMVEKDTTQQTQHNRHDRHDRHTADDTTVHKEKGTVSVLLARLCGRYVSYQNTPVLVPQRRSSPIYYCCTIV